MGLNQYPGNVITANKTSPTVESASGVWTIEEAYQNIRNWPMALNTVYDSLKFNSADSAYLSMTPPGVGGRSKFTYSFWLKVTKPSTQIFLLSAPFSSSQNGSTISIESSGQFYAGLRLYNTGSQGTFDAEVYSNMLFRDPSAWYHIVFTLDTTAASADAMKLYVNGVSQSFASYDAPTANAVQYIGSEFTHYIGRLRSATGTLDGYLTEINFIDGLALDADYFGFFDANGIWQPRAYKGAYGTNGFYLPMRESATAAGFSTVTYTGNGSTQYVSGVGFAPDMVWIKDRTSTGSHVITDIVRGSDKRLFPNLTAAESTNSNTLTAFNPDGFAVGNDGVANTSGYNYVGWCWDAGSSTVTNNSGTIESQVRANQTYGFSIVTYTGTGSNATIGHGLGATPAFFVTKQRSGIENWIVYHQNQNISPASGHLMLQSTAAFTSSSTVFNNTAPTSTVFSVGTAGGTNESGQTFVAYCFAEISGYSKFGSYSGTGSAGNSVTLGFKPAFVVIKQINASGQSWYMADNTRDPVSPIGLLLEANSSGAEFDSGGSLTFTNTGFTINETGTGFNASGSTYIYMAFADTRAYSAFDDYSGNGNNWQPNNIGTDDVYVDVPTNWGTDTGVGGEVRGNYATLNPLDEPSSYAAYGSASNGNLTFSVSNDAAMGATFAVSSGKWYWEMTVVSGHSAGSNTVWAAIASSTPSSVNKLPNQSGSGGRSYATTGSKFNENTSSSYGNTYTNGDVIGCALDLDNGKVYWSKNGTFQASGDPVAGTNAAFTGLTGTWLPVAFSNAPVISFNFGATPFAYTAPSGFKALCTQNLPEPTIADGEDYMDALLWTGNGSTQNITGLSFQPDLVWTKDRGAAYDHTWFDAVRGATKFLRSNATSAEETQSDSLTSFNSNGFSVGADAVRNNINKSGASYVSWNWKANGAGVTNNVGDIQSTVSANTTAGFSVVTYTGNATSGATVGHGLSAQPSMIIVKDRTNGTKPWAVYHASVSGAPGNILYLNSTSGANADNQFNVTPTSTVFSLGSGTYTNNSGDNYVAYCFAPIAGYSAFGSYTGNGSTDGPFVYCGFRPRYVMIKNYTSSGNGWILIDTARSTYNQTALQIYANSSAAEASSTAYLDILSNGFKARSGNSDINDSAVGYIYAAFAENPFKLSRAR